MFLLHVSLFFGNNENCAAAENAEKTMSMYEKHIFLFHISLHNPLLFSYNHHALFHQHDIISLQRETRKSNRVKTSQLVTTCDSAGDPRLTPAPSHDGVRAEDDTRETMPIHGELSGYGEITHIYVDIILEHLSLFDVNIKKNASHQFTTIFNMCLDRSYLT